MKRRHKKPREVHQDDLYTLARVAQTEVEFPGPEGGWATAKINGRLYKARLAPVEKRDES